MHAASLLLGLTLAAGFHPPAPVAADDVRRFPPEWLVEQQRGFLDGRQEWLACQRQLYGDPYWSPWFDAAENDARARRACWDNLHWARQWIAYGSDDAAPNCWDERVRGQLAELRDRIGQPAYDQGVMPGPMDPVFFRRGD